MAKTSFKIKVIADQGSFNKVSSQMRFIVPGPEVKPTAPGQQIQQTAKTVIVCTFTDPKAYQQFEGGKEYTLTIE